MSVSSKPVRGTYQNLTQQNKTNISTLIIYQAHFNLFKQDLTLWPDMYNKTETGRETWICYIHSTTEEEVDRSVNWSFLYLKPLLCSVERLALAPRVAYLALFSISFLCWEQKQGLGTLGPKWACQVFSVTLGTRSFRPVAPTCSQVTRVIREVWEILIRTDLNV